MALKIGNDFIFRQSVERRRKREQCTEHLGWCSSKISKFVNGDRHLLTLVRENSSDSIVCPFLSDWRRDWWKFLQFWMRSWFWEWSRRSTPCWAASCLLIATWSISARSPALYLQCSRLASRRCLPAFHLHILYLDAWLGESQVCTGDAWASSIARWG